MLSSGSRFIRGSMALVLGCAALSASLRAADDRVTLFKNNEVRIGRVKSATMEGIQLEMLDPKTRQPLNMVLQLAEVSAIEWDAGDPEFRTGYSNFEGKNYPDAARSFMSILSDKEEYDKMRGEVKPALLYFCAESLYRGGKPAEAVPIFEKLMNEFKNSFYVPLAVGSLVDASILAKDFAKVPPLLAQLRTLGTEQKALADYYEGQLLFAQGKTKPADEKFGQAAAGAASATTKGMSLMGQAKCAIADNNLTKARDLAQRALAAGAPAAVAGAAHLVIGDAIVAEIDAQKVTGDAMQTKLMDALLEYMRVQEQYRGDVDSEAQAILHSGDCLMKLSKFKDRGADVHRAVYMYTKLISDSRYRNTRWAPMAAEAMKNVGKK